MGALSFAGIFEAPMHIRVLGGSFFASKHFPLLLMEFVDSLRFLRKFKLDKLPIYLGLTDFFGLFGVVFYNPCGFILGRLALTRSISLRKAVGNKIDSLHILLFSSLHSKDCKLKFTRFMGVRAA